MQSQILIERLFAPLDAIEVETVARAVAAAERLRIAPFARVPRRGSRGIGQRLSLLTTMSTMITDAQSGAKAFEGNIAELPIPELLQFIHISGRDGVLVVSDVAGKPRGNAARGRSSTARRARNRKCARSSSACLPRT